MDTYSLFTDKKTIVQDSFTIVLKELIELIHDEGIPEVKYNTDKHATELKFEGRYCNFSVYLK